MRCASELHVLLLVKVSGGCSKCFNVFNMVVKTSVSFSSLSGQKNAWCARLQSFYTFTLEGTDVAARAILSFRAFE